MIMKACILPKADSKSCCGLSHSFIALSFAHSLIFLYTVFEKAVNLLWVSLSLFNLNASRSEYDHLVNSQLIYPKERSLHFCTRL